MIRCREYRTKPYYSIFFIAIFTSCTVDYLEYVEYIPSPDKKWNYGLYVDNVGIGDLGFYVLKLEKEIDPKHLKIRWRFNDGISQEDVDWLERKTIFSNYEEAGYNASNPKIKIIEEKYLVLSRGGFYYSLYDLKSDSVILNLDSPWNSWRETYERPADYSHDADKEEELYDKWIEENLHNKILTYLK